MVKEKSGPHFLHSVVAGLFLMVLLAPACYGETKPGSGPKSSFDFKDVDTDGNGCVEGAQELQKFRAEVGRILGESVGLGELEKALRVAKITLSADVSGDGRICECDLLSILLSETSGPGRHHHAFRVYEDGSIFDDVDGDKDGLLGPAESEALAEKLAKCVALDKARAAVSAMGKLAQEDGKVSRYEYLQFLAPVSLAQAARREPTRSEQSPLQPPGAVPGRWTSSTAKVIPAPPAQPGDGGTSALAAEEAVPGPDAVLPRPAAAVVDPVSPLERDLKESEELSRPVSLLGQQPSARQFPDVGQGQLEESPRTASGSEAARAAKVAVPESPARLVRK